MSKIRSKNTRLEKAVFSELRKRKIYFKRHYAKALGNPDIALPRKKIAIFLDGDFWHGHKFSLLKKRLPKRYWVPKIEKNIKRDRKNRLALKKNGWKILRVWEHELAKDSDKSIKRITAFLKSN